MLLAIPAEFIGAPLSKATLAIGCDPAHPREMKWQGACG